MVKKPGIKPDIKYLFEPRSVAIIGASDNRDKIGYRIVENIIKSGYNGGVYPVNPKGGKLLGLQVYKSVRDIKNDIDIAVIVIPSNFVFEVVKSCAKKKVKHLVIITSGFSEIGNIKQEREIVDFAHKNNMRVLGPNMFGIYSSMAPINASFGPNEIKAGNVALITQSGAIGVAMFGRTKSENIGLSCVVSVGNKSDIDEVDLLEYLMTNKSTKVILMYIEGIKNGEALVEVLNRLTKKKPVIVIKSGKSKIGAIAAASHTGSLAGTDEIFTDVMKQCGVLRAETIDEALNWCKFLSNAPIPKGENSVIITNGGGIGVLAADACEKYGVKLYDDIDAMKRIFSNIVPEIGSLRNPIDLTGPASIADYEHALNAAVNEKNIHSIICIGCETAIFDVVNFPKFIENFYRNSDPKKPIVFSFLGGTELENSMAILKHRGVPIFSDVYDAISCLGAMNNNYNNIISIKKTQRTERVQQRIKLDQDLIFDTVNTVIKDDRQFMLSFEAAKVITSAKIPMPKSYLAHNIGEAVQYSEKLGYPVVMKIISKDIIHKTDVGGVALDLENKIEVLNAYQAIILNCRKNKPNAKILGVEITQMIQEGVETIVGVRRDKFFGPIVMFGLGGIYVEILKDISFRALPITKNDAMAMIKEIKAYPLLLGVRGEDKKDINKIAEIILSLGQIILENDSISDIEINPLVVYDEGDGAKAVDARILLSECSGDSEMIKL